jgi:hypothetical protein
MSVGGMNEDGSHTVGTSGQLRQNPEDTSECFRQLSGDFQGVATNPPAGGSKKHEDFVIF